MAFTAAPLKVVPTTTLRCTSVPPCRVAAGGRRSVKVAAAKINENTSVARRDLLLAALTVPALSAAPARAFLGIGEGSAAEVYSKETADILAKVRNVVALDRDDPDRDTKIKIVRNDINSWVAKYRRDVTFSGRPSYGNTYSALNTLAGHYNSFGTQANIPKKRMDRLQKELDDAEKLLARGR